MSEMRQRALTLIATTRCDWNARAPAAATGPLVRASRALRLALHLAHGIALGALVYPRRSPARQRAMIQSWSRRLLRILNVELRCFDQPAAPLEKYLLVANHVSWLDIFAINALFPATFVAKAEVRDWPLVGKLAARIGTLFIERGTARGARRAQDDIAAALGSGERPVVVFPEGTTTNGDGLKPFRPALLQAAVNTGALVRPLALRYVDDRGARCEVPAWVGEATLIESILALVAQPRLALEMRFLPAWPAAHHGRREIALRAQADVATALGIQRPREPAFPACRI